MAGASSSNNGTGDVNGASPELSNSFRDRVAYMKNWKPASTPSNRDRLELYALHKQAISGDAPANMSTADTQPGERAKYQAWRNKAGISTPEAMRLYIQESDRQLRVYGSGGGSFNYSSSAQQYSQQQQQQQQQSTLHQPRGLAAIPLLCAAACESRQAYLRRLTTTDLQHAWWKRQEALTAPPGTLLSLPETLLLKAAALVEYLSLVSAVSPGPADYIPLPPPVVQSFFWPLHNLALALWMTYILWWTAAATIWELWRTLLLGTRVTGTSLSVLWMDQVGWTARSVYTLTASHQAVSVRVLGLLLTPYTVLVDTVNWVTGGESVPTNSNGMLMDHRENASASSSTSLIVATVLYTFLLTVCTWWYWTLVLPWFCLCLAGIALASGHCFALIELAGV